MTKNIINVNNEWGQLKEAFVGIVDYENMIEPEYMDALKWESDEVIGYLNQYGGKKTDEFFHDALTELDSQVNSIANILSEYGVNVHRNIVLAYQEEKDFLTDVQKGYTATGGADFFLVIKDKAILLNNMRCPFRRKQMYSIRPVLEPILKNSNATYVALPPASPHYTDNDIYLERGDVLIDGYNVYVGFSGNGSSKAGIEWLEQFLGSAYKICVIKLHPKILHLDTVLMFNRPGLLTYYPEYVEDLPYTLKHWDKIEVHSQPNEHLTFGANSISINESTIVAGSEYQRLVPEYEKRGIQIIHTPLQRSYQWGAGARCLVGVLHRA